MLATDYLIHLRNKMFKFEEINKKKILKSDLLSDDKAIHFFTTRESVVTHKELDEYIGLAKTNLDEISKYLNIPVENIISPEQTHSCNIDIAQKGRTYPNTDALIVSEKDIAILLNFADCTPIILYDEENNIGAIAHAGWKGTASSIVPKTINKMIELYKSKPSNMYAIIGPAISMSNYEVGEEVYNAVKSTLKNNYIDYFSYNRETNKYNIDLKTINKHQLEELGIKRIDMCNYCTYDSVDVFFSYRKEYGNTARHSAVLKLV